MTFEKEEYLRRYLDGELTDNEEQKALMKIAVDPEMRALLKFDLRLQKRLSWDSKRNPSEGGTAGKTRHEGPDATGKPGAMPDQDAAERPGFEREEDDPEYAGLPGSAETEAFTLPEGFADRVMQAIEQREMEAAGASVAADEPPADAGPGSAEKESRLRPLKGGRHGAWERFWQPRPVMWRPAWSAGIAAALLMLIVLMPLLLLSPSDEVQPARLPVRQIVEEQHDRVLMRFVYVDREAESVAVAGDFSDWEPITLTRQNINGDVAWTGIIPLERGQHRYMFLKDGEQWATDPLAGRYIDDGFGNKNAVINL